MVAFLLQAIGQAISRAGADVADSGREGAGESFN